MTDEPVRRTSEIEEFTNLHVVHPISASLIPYFVAWRITPNMVSITGMVCGLLAGVMYYLYGHGPRLCWPYAVLGFVLMVVWHVMDGADGQLARLTKAQSELGKILDGVCDYVTFIAVYCGLALALAPQRGAWVWLLIAVAGLCHAVQSAAYEVQRQEYDVIGWGRSSKQLQPPKPLASGSGAGPLQHAFNLLYRGYVKVQLLTVGGSLELVQRLDQTLAERPEEAELLRRRYRATFAAGVRRWAILSANYRTIGIFLFAMFGLPLSYFLVEIILFTGVMVLLLPEKKRQSRAFLASLAATSR